MKRLFFVILFVPLYQAAIAQSWADTANMITHFFDRYQPDHPGCQLSISRGGKIIFSKAWGLADIERGVPYTTETITEAGSITKQFTAAAILLLEQQGKLSLEDDIRKYLPEFPNYGPVMRLKYLLHHTSGIREWSNLEAITGWPRTTKAYTNEDVFNMLCRQEKLNNIPGTEYIYSNSNYILLCKIVEKASRMTLPDFTKQYLFKPAGMTHTSWRDDFKKVVPNRGVAYIKSGDSYRINMPNENVYGPGALLTTTEDLLKWTNYFLSNKLGSPGLLEKQLALEKMPGGVENDYAAGLFIGEFRGLKIISHTGQTAGYVGVVESLPELQLSVAWLSNTTEFNDSMFVGITAIDNLFIKDKSIQAETKSVVTIANPPVIKARKYAGWYRYNNTNKGINISMRHDTLLVNNTRLIPVNETEFKYQDSFIKFDSLGGFVLTETNKMHLAFTREKDVKVTPAYLKAFAGNYYSKETDSRFKLMLKNGQLMLEANYLRDVVLLPTYNNAFNFNLNVDSDTQPVASNVLFERNIKGGMIRCEVSMDDARKIKFIKMQ